MGVTISNGQYNKYRQHLNGHLDPQDCYNTCNISDGSIRSSDSNNQIMLLIMQSYLIILIKNYI